MSSIIPSVIFGVGGTGVAALSYLKRLLVDTYGMATYNALPVQLLAIDTVFPTDNIEQIGTDVATLSEEGYEELNQRFKYQGLDRNTEFVKIPSDPVKASTLELHNNALDDRNGRNTPPVIPHISRWYRGEVNESDLNLVDGANRIRQLGRLALFKGLNQRGHNDPIYNRISVAIHTAMEHAQDEQRTNIPVYIVGSMAGGTGSSIFMDIAMLVRQISQQTTIYGMLGLTSIFDGDRHTQKSVRGFATWRELNRMMTIERDITSFNMQWNKDVQNPITHRVEAPIFDHVYLIDNRLDGRANEVRKPHDLAFPVMAEALNFLIDRHAGSQYIEHITANLAERRDNIDIKGRATYSTLYVHVWQRPVAFYYAQAQHEMLIDYLTILSRPDQLRRALTRHEDIGSTAILADEVHEEVGNILARQWEEQIGNQSFILKQDEIRKMGNNARAQAIANWEYRADRLIDYVQLTGDRRLRLSQNLVEQMELHIPSFENGIDPDVLLADVEDLERNLYGQNRRGVYPQLYGEFDNNIKKGLMYDNLLRRIHPYITRTFTKRVEYWIQRQLSYRYGQTINLDLVIQTLDLLMQRLEMNLEFYTDAQNKLPNVMEMRREARAQLEEAKTTIENCGLACRLRNRHVREANTWIRMEIDHKYAMHNQRAVEIMKYTLQEMIHITKTLRDNYIELAQRLAIGSDVEDFRGVLGALKESKDRLAHYYQLNRGNSLAYNYFENPYDQQLRASDQVMNWLLSITHWQIDENLNVSVNIRYGENPEDVLEFRIDQEYNEQAETQLVQNLLNKVAERAFGGVGRVLERSPILDVLDANAFAESLPTYNTTLFKRSIHGGSGQKTFYVGVYDQPINNEDPNMNNTRKIEVIREAVKNMGGAETMNNAVVSISNPSRIVIFSAEEAMLPESFGTWEQGKKTYQDMLTGNAEHGIRRDWEYVRRSHIFSAEQSTVEMEYQHYEKHNSLRLLDSHTVELLTDETILIDFLKLWSLGLIRRLRFDSGENQTIWQLNTPDGRQATLFTESISEVTQRMMFANIPTLVRMYARETRQLRDNNVDVHRELTMHMHALHDNPRQKQELVERYEAEQAFCDEVQQLHRRYDMDSINYRKSMTDILNNRQKERNATREARQQQQEVNTGNSQSLVDIFEARGRSSYLNQDWLLSEWLVAEMIGFHGANPMDRSQASIHLDLIEVYLPERFKMLIAEQR